MAIVKHNWSLGEISLSFKKIRHISANTFSILKTLTYLYLDKKICIDARATTQAPVPASVSNAIFKCFSIENDQNFKTCQSNVLELQQVNSFLLDLKKKLENVNQIVQAEIKEVKENLQICLTETIIGCIQIRQFLQAFIKIRQ